LGYSGHLSNRATTSCCNVVFHIQAVHTTFQFVIYYLLFIVRCGWRKPGKTGRKVAILSAGKK
jgi:hypothetical protein